MSEAALYISRSGGKVLIPWVAGNHWWQKIWEGTFEDGVLCRSDDPDVMLQITVHEANGQAFAVAMLKSPERGFTVQTADPQPQRALDHLWAAIGIHVQDIVPDPADIRKVSELLDPPKAKWWGLDGAERFHCTSLEAAILEWVESHTLPEPGHVVSFVGMAPKHLPEPETYADDVVENLLEQLHESYGDPEDYHEATDGMKQAATKFVEKVFKEYTVWQCDPVEYKDVDVIEWLQANKPELLEMENR